MASTVTFVNQVEVSRSGPRPVVSAALKRAVTLTTTRSTERLRKGGSRKITPKLIKAVRSTGGGRVRKVAELW